FSSRRRHTISKRDWSSDVCSSDLTINPCEIYYYDYGASNFRRKDVRQDLEMIGLEPNYSTTIDGERVKVIRIKNNKLFNKTVSRSEERRVGKECRDQWARSKKNNT